MSDFTDGYDVYDQLMVTLGGTMLITVCVVWFAAYCFFGRNIAPVLKRRKRAAQIREAYIQGVEDYNTVMDILDYKDPDDVDDKFEEIRKKYNPEDEQ
ncbi:hypothetical protein [Rathayibacter sp. VKM Ac-2805]|uniref:hypothetical protein n=1 Tax=Rathayibacter sp. VKM Ac-2805 TaxID=2609258 RepID=UPI0013202027|nr:hypothetical protein [Rathayibacter sp. VKM Ac-2805]QHC73765.1 hypothetical protein GSU40_08810 [Rathayibacter sp. VKM Ac-2805]